MNYYKELVMYGTIATIRATISILFSSASYCVLLKKILDGRIEKISIHGIHHMSSGGFFFSFFTEQALNKSGTIEPNMFTKKFFKM
jgi:hypothetical protein